MRSPASAANPTTITGARYAARSSGQPSAQAVTATMQATATAAAENRSVRMGQGYASVRGRSRQLRLRRRLCRRVPRLSVPLQRRRFRRARDGSRRQARPAGRERARRRRDGRPGRARRAGRHRRAPFVARPLSRSPLGRDLPRRGRVARLLVEEARLSRRVARPPREGGKARGRLRRAIGRVRLPRSERRARAARAAADAELARAPVPAVIRTPSWYVVAGPAYLAALLAVDTEVGLHAQYALGALTWLVLLAALRPLPALARAQALGVVAFATVGEVTGSLVWGVYRYRLHNLPLFIPPAHGLVYLSGLALAGVVSRRLVVGIAAAGAVGWGIAGLTVLPRLDVAGAFGVPLLCVFLWRSCSRAVYAGVFLVVAALELYGTSIGTWRWAATLPGLGIPDGNPPSGVACGYVWFDVMALLVAPSLVRVARRVSYLTIMTGQGACSDTRSAVDPSR